MCSFLRKILQTQWLNLTEQTWVNLSERYSKYVDIAKRDSLRLCGICETECPFWNVRANPQVLIDYFLRRNWLSSLKGSLLHYHKSIYTYLFEWSEREVLLDASKNIRWIRRQLSPAYLWKEVIPLILFIHRDGRAVVNSYLRKFPEKTIEQATLEWKRNLEDIQRFYSKFPSQQRFDISYERLAAQPREEVNRLCEFLQIEFSPGMLCYWEFDHHVVGGNFGTRSLIFRYRQEVDGMNGEMSVKKLRGLAEQRKHYYEKIGLGIKLDSRWQVELSDADLEIFQAIGGELNRKLMKEV